MEIDEAREPNASILSLEIPEKEFKEKLGIPNYGSVKQMSHDGNVSFIVDATKYADVYNFKTGEFLKKVCNINHGEILDLNQHYNLHDVKTIYIKVRFRPDKKKWWWRTQKILDI